MFLLTDLISALKKKDHSRIKNLGWLNQYLIVGAGLHMGGLQKLVQEAKARRVEADQIAMQYNIPFNHAYGDLISAGLGALRAEALQIAGIAAIVKKDDKQALNELRTACEHVIDLQLAIISARDDLQKSVKNHFLVSK